MKKIEEKIGEILIENKMQLAVAESCTGGLISSFLTNVSGSSNYIKQNFVTYANEAKIRYLGVKEITLKKFGAVSSEVAKQMAEGLIKNTNCDIALATTGIAGPNNIGKKPVGLIFIAVANKKETKVIKYNSNFKLSRIKIKKDFAKTALKILYKFIT